MNQKKNGLFISEQRKKKNLTQQELAERLGISTNAVSKWERGLSFPDVSLYKDLCKILDISIEELINGEKDDSEEAKEKAIITTIKSKNKEKKKVISISIMALLLIICLITSGVYYYHNYTSETETLEAYYKRNYERSLEARDLEALLRMRNDGNLPDYYGGVYISNDSYNLIVQIVEERLPKEGTMEYMYYNEIFTVSEAIKVEYVKNSYNELEDVMNRLNEYFTNHEHLKDMNGYGIDIINNSVTVFFVKATDEMIDDFKKNILDSKVLRFESSIDTIKDYDLCTNYPDDIGDTLNKSEKKELLISISKEQEGKIPVVLSLYDDGTYELFTAYRECPPGRICTLMLVYTKSVKGTYEIDVDKILELSTNADDYEYDSNKRPKYSIWLGDKYIEKYDTTEFFVEKGKKNRYIDELLKQIDVDLSMCAKPEFYE